MTGSSEKRFALIGAMGSGKSSLARSYASRYNVDYFDTDSEFVRRYGAIDAYFAAHGEDSFRDIEQNLMIEAAKSDAKIIATGGGAILNKRGINALRSACDIVYLNAPIDVLEVRIAKSKRPLKNNLREVFAQRETLYKKYADYTVDSTVDAFTEFEKAIALPRYNRYDCVFCDADETLLDFKSAMRWSILGATREMGITVSDDIVYDKYSRITYTVWNMLERGEIGFGDMRRIQFEMLIKELGANVSAQEYGTKFIDRIMTTRYVLFGAIDFLKSLRSRNVKVYITTNSFTQIAEQRLKVLDGCIDGAFVSQAVGYSKPDKRFFDAVLSACGIVDKSRVIVFGDSETSDIAGGIAAGLDTCLFDVTRKKQTAADFTAYDYDGFLRLI